MCTAMDQQCSSAASDATAAAAVPAAAAGQPPSWEAAAAAPSDRGAAWEPAVPLDVPHIRQCFNWDCGLACVLMALRALGQAGLDMPALRALCPTTSIWTVDLAHLLRARGAAVSLLTVTLGANAAYAGEGFYAESMREDGARVERLFGAAAAAGIPVQQRSLPLRELASLVGAGRHLVIALVDKRALLADPSVRAAVGDAAPGGLGGGLPPEPLLPPGGGYTGHYLLLCGYDAAAAEFGVRDPAAARPEVRVPAATLEAARKAFGTDEDLLLIEVPAAPAAAAAVAGA